MSEAKKWLGPCPNCAAFRKILASPGLAAALPPDELKANAQACYQCAQGTCNSSPVVADMLKLFKEQTPEQKASGLGFKPQEIKAVFDECMKQDPSRKAADLITITLNDKLQKANEKLEKAKKVEQAVVKRILARAPDVPNRPIRAAGASSPAAIRAAGASTTSIAPRPSISPLYSSIFVLDPSQKKRGQGGLSQFYRDPTLKVGCRMSRDKDCKKSVAEPTYGTSFPSPPSDLKWDTDVIKPGVSFSLNKELYAFKTYMSWHFASKHPYTTETSTILLLLIDVPKLPFRTTPQTVCYGEVEVKLNNRDKLGGLFTFLPRTDKTAVIVEIGNYGTIDLNMEGTISCRMWINSANNPLDIRTHLWSRYREQQVERLGYTLITAEGERLHVHKDVILARVPNLEKLVSLGKANNQHTLPAHIGIRAVHAFAEFLYWGELLGQNPPPLADSKTAPPLESKTTPTPGASLDELWRLVDYLQLQPLQAFLIPRVAMAIADGTLAFPNALNLFKTYQLPCWKEAINSLIKKNPDLLWQSAIDVSVKN